MARRDGYVLMAALWVVVLVSAAGIHAAATVRYKRLYSRNLLDMQHARAAVSSALATTRADLSRLLITGSIGANDPWYSAPEIVQTSGEVGGWRYESSARDAEASVNINTATQDQLERFFLALNVEKAQESAVALVAARQRSGGFQEIMELAQGDSSLSHAFDMMEPFITVAGAGQINLNTAPRPVLLSLPGFSPRAADVIAEMQANRQRIHSSFQIINALSGDERMQMAAVLPNLEKLVTTETRTILVTVEAKSSGAVMRARATAEFGRQGVTARLNAVDWM
jgi:DNA uptake protein ComE-like DNA-binding protein